MKKIAILGSSASGKTDLAHALALKINAVILSLDSMCVYKELSIINAKPDETMLNEIRYFGINLISVNEEFNVALFFEEFKKACEYAKNNDKNLIICGGTSFYLKAMLDGLSAKIPEISHNLSLDEIYNLKEKIDKDAKIEKNDKFRLNKWYSVYLSTNEIPSEWLKNNKFEPVLKDVLIFNLVWDKEKLYERIQKRTAQMLILGAKNEVLEQYFKYGKIKALQSIGAKEIIDNYEGLIDDENLEELINIHTRQLAKRQRTFNKQFDTININANDNLTLKNILFIIKDKYAKL